MKIISIVAFLSFLSMSFNYEIAEEESVFEKMVCPAFLVFENVAYLADMTFELPCNCKPEEVNSVVWYFQKDLGHNETRVLTDFNGTKIIDSSDIKTGSDIMNRFAIRMFSLIIFQSQVEDSGHYICGSAKGDFFYGYDIDVQPSEGAHLAFIDIDQKPLSDMETATYKIFSSFWAWGKCDRCDIRGEQTRIGLCYFKSQYLFTRYRTPMPHVVSCGSAAIPRRFRGILNVRKTEVVVRSCYEPCPKTPSPLEGKHSIFEVVSALEEKQLNLAVPIQYYSHPLGYPLTLMCPGTRPEHSVAWDKSTFQLYRSQYMAGVNKSMRVFIDHGNHLRFKYIEHDDKGIYYCWQQGKKVAGFRLSISYRSKRARKFSDPETQFAFKTVLTSYIFITAIFIVLHLLKCVRYFFKIPHN
ncbi:Ig-like V-type domain-containing protein FAM187A [Protopterus annectens]|uniref:Ig-like V-type domain-containing protein FAM187A n=1 Tax=Protopterus annectens TaxID=7888 RepID=UPI001CFC41F6|nr:Ig-like V-type domain-containing protein FAM187A [Protopterus annectens]